MKFPGTVLLVGWVCVGLALAADVIETKDGEVLRGKILRETADAVTIEVPFSETISEERVISKKDIVKMEKSAPDAEAFKKLSELSVPDTVMEPQVYDRALSELRLFVARFPESEHLPKVKEMLKKLQAEQDVIRQGGIKLEGVLMAPEVARERATEIQGLRLLAEWKQRGESGDLLGAVNQFFEWEKANVQNPVYPSAVELTIGQLRSLIARLDHEIRNYPFLEERRQKQLALASPADQAAINATRQRQETELKAAIEAAKKAKVVIPPFETFSLKSMEDARKAAQAQVARLSTLNLQGMRSSHQEVEQARKAKSEGDWGRVRQHAQAALSFWAQNTAATALLKEAEAAEKAKPTPRPASSERSQSFSP